jgi:DUF4097 and DUF4098 domain-containing protein YvlB
MIRWFLILIALTSQASTPDSGTVGLRPALSLKLEHDGRFWNVEVSGVLPAQRVYRITAAGDLTVRGKRHAEIRFTLTQRLRVPDEATARRIAESFTAHSLNGQLFFPQDAATRVELPQSTRQLALWSPGGNIDAADIDGSVRADTAAGRILLDRIAGDAEIHSGGGATTIGSIGGLVHCYSAGGPIRAVQVRGQSVFQTEGGDIDLGEVLGTVRAMTAAGSIHIDQAGGAVFADTYGGPISILSALGAIVAQSGVGTIRLNNVSGRMRAATQSGSIVAEVLRGHPLEDSFLSTRAGDITVFLPSDTGVTVEARTDGAVDSDFPGLRRAGASIRGRINGGGPTLTLVGMGGRIEIRKE